MDWTQITLYTTSEALEIIGGYLLSHGVGGLMIEDAQDFKNFLDSDEIHWDYIEEELMARKEAPTNVKFYLPNNLQGMEIFRDIRAGLAGLRTLNDDMDLGSLEITTDSVQEEEWSTAWKKYYHPVKIGKKLVVCPQWEEYELQEGEVKVTLDPGMAFGTGTHETTRLCMRLLEDCVKPQSTVLDIGTGSGILAITSLLLGAKSAVGVDIEELAIQIAQENANLNGVGERITLKCGDLAEKVSGTYDVICANIVADIIIRLCENVTDFMHENTVLLVSGIIEERCEEVAAALRGAGLQERERFIENGWVAIKATK